MKKLFFALCSALAFQEISAQCNGSLLQPGDSVFTNPFFGIALSPEADKLNRPYDYVATNSGGIKIYNVTGSSTPVLKTTIPTSSLGGLNAINLYQDSIWLYASLGDVWDTTQYSGLAIIDVSNPLAPVVLNTYTHTGIKCGAGGVAVSGTLACLAANRNGLVLLDVSNKSAIQLKGQLSFSNAFPHSNIGSSSLYNARGVAVKNNYAFVCYDRGGFRVVDISNPAAPSQVAQYCFPPLINKATAYNNVVINNNVAYVAIDYYGMEVLNISNPLAIVQTGWWHPATWADTTNNFNTWAGSQGHANELAYDPGCGMVYLAAGKTDLAAIDVSNPASPVTCKTYGSTTDTYGTWGLDFFNHQIHLSYIWSPAAPPNSNYTGLKTLTVNCLPAGLQEHDIAAVTVYPNPASSEITINSEGSAFSVRIYDVNGRLTMETASRRFSVVTLPPGLYTLLIQSGDGIQTTRFVRE
jgi:hypothetical protein